MGNKGYAACLCIQSDTTSHTNGNESGTAHLILILSTNFNLGYFHYVLEFEGS